MYTMTFFFLSCLFLFIVIKSYVEIVTELHVSTDPYVLFCNFFILNNILNSIGN